MNSKSKKILHYRPIFFAFMSMFIGIVLSHKLFMGSLPAIACVVVLFTIMVVISFMQRKFAPIAVCIFAFFLGFGLSFAQLNFIKAEKITGEVQIVGQIERSLASKDSYDSFVLKNVSVDGKEIRNVRVSIWKFTDDTLEVGDILFFKGELENVSYFTFGDYNSSPQRNGYYYTTKVKDNEILNITKGELDLNERVRLYVKDILYANMGEENAPLAYAVLFGDRTQVSDDILTSYNNAGILHLLAVSGLHVGFIAGLIYALLSKLKLKRLFSFIITACLLLFYNYLCNFTPSVVRATIMICVGLFANVLGKKSDTLTTIGIAGILTLLIKPLWAFDIGFQLSYFCVISIVILSPSLTYYLKKIMPELFASAFSVTIAVNLGTIPIIASIQGGLNFLTLITNLFSLAYFSFLFPFFVICLILNLIFPFLSFLLKFCDFGFGCLNQFAGYMASTNLQITFSKFDIITTIIIYLAIFVMSHILMSDRKVKVCFLCVLFGVFGLRLDFSTIKTCESGINVLNYYDSQSIVLESSHGNNALIFLNESDFIEKYKRNNNLNINYLFILGDIHKCTITNFNSSLYETIITTEDINIYDNINVVEQNVSYKITDFTFTYINSENLDGLLVEYDDLSIFIAKNLKDEIDVTLDCDVLIGTPINSFARAVVNEKSAYNFENYGNFKLVGNELKVRRLD